MWSDSFSNLSGNWINTKKDDPNIPEVGLINQSGEQRAGISQDGKHYANEVRKRSYPKRIRGKKI